MSFLYVSNYLTCFEFSWYQDGISVNEQSPGCVTTALSWPNRWVARGGHHGSHRTDTGAISSPLEIRRGYKTMEYSHHGKPPCQHMAKGLKGKLYRLGFFTEPANPSISTSNGLEVVAPPMEDKPSIHSNIEDARVLHLDGRYFPLLHGPRPAGLSRPTI